MNYYYRAPQEKWETEKEKGKDRQETSPLSLLLWCLWSEAWPRKSLPKSARRIVLAGEKNGVQIFTPALETMTAPYYLFKE